MRFWTEKYFKVAAFCVLTMDIASSIDFDWAGWFFSHEITPFAETIFETMYKKWCSLNMCHRIQLHMKKSKRIVNYFVGVAPVTGVLYWRKSRQTDLFCFISFHSLLLNLCVLFIFICNFLAQELMRIISFQMRDKLFVNGKKVGCYYPSVN